MTSASHGFKTLRSRGIASKGDPRESLRVVARFWGAHAARVQISAASPKPSDSARAELGQEFASRGRDRQHASRVRFPETIPTNSLERPLIGLCDHSKINFFQSLRLLLQIKFFSHC